MITNKIKTFGFVAFMVLVVLVITSCELENETPYVAPPTGVIATPLANRQIHVTWNAVSVGGSRQNFDGYELFWRTELDSADTRRPGVTGWNRVMITSLQFTPSSAVAGTAVGNHIFIYMRTQYRRSTTNDGRTTTAIRHSSFSVPVQVRLQ